MLRYVLSVYVCVFHDEFHINETKQIGDKYFFVVELSDSVVTKLISSYTSQYGL